MLRRPHLPLDIGPEDYRVRLRAANSLSLIIILLDLSGSMAAMRRISIAKGIVRRIIEDSYVRRSHLSVIVFKGNDADILIRPTKAYEAVYKMIDELSVGGTTPLPAALAKLLNIVRGFRAKSNHAFVSAVLVTDGKANVPIRRSVAEDIHELCLAIRKAGVRVVIYPTEVKAFDPTPTYIDQLVTWCGAEVNRYELGNP
ncbi:MAG: VWA domain-containing protein [Vulcanisaeta sp.]|uniref:VWA domain-containing protein n=1 Tax=Vulcanisaeta sp. TaxID=2020871 RepID=UPI003D0B8DC9